MAKRLTPARIERWQRDKDKAFELLDLVEREAAEYRVVSKGGRASNLTYVMLAARTGKQAVGLLGGELAKLHGSETR